MTRDRVSLLQLFLLATVAWRESEHGRSCYPDSLREAAQGHLYQRHLHNRFGRFMRHSDPKVSAAVCRCLRTLQRKGLLERHEQPGHLYYFSRPTVPFTITGQGRRYLEDHRWCLWVG